MVRKWIQNEILLIAVVDTTIRKYDNLTYLYLYSRLEYLSFIRRLMLLKNQEFWPIWPFFSWKPVDTVSECVSTNNFLRWQYILNIIDIEYLRFDSQSKSTYFNNRWWWLGGCVCKVISANKQSVVVLIAAYTWHTDRRTTIWI